MRSSGNVFERLWKLEASVNKLVLDGKKEPEEVCRVLQNVIDAGSCPCTLAFWEYFYKEVFQIEADFSRLALPKKRQGFDYLLVVAQGLTIEQVFAKCKELFPCWKWCTDDDLDEVVESDRSSKDGHYALWLRDRVEADEELANLSANQLKEKKIPRITLLERLLMELEYFKRTGKHLDIQNITLCAGSRLSSGAVPLVNWDGDGLLVHWYYPGSAYGGGLRSRSAVI